MKNLKEKKRPFWVKTVAIPIFTFICILTFLIIGIKRFSDLGKEQELILTESALRKSIVQCYAIEGFYPAELSYLEDNYNLTIDKDKYNIYYECFSSNIMPEFGVYEK